MIPLLTGTHPDPFAVHAMNHGEISEISEISVVTNTCG
jgi:hypothetical protein